MSISILLALIPPITWGATGIIGTKMGGSAAQQTFGESCGALILALGVYLFFVIPNGITVDGKIWLVGLCSGLFWSVGTVGQFFAYKKMGVSAAFPLSTAGQIVCNALMAAAVLGEWTTLNMWFFGIISIALVTVGALLTAARSKAEKKTAKKRPSTYMQGLFALLLSTIGFMLYFVFPNLLVKVGFISERIHNANNGINYMTAIVTPQAVGQVIGSALIGYFILHEKQLLGKPTFKNLVTGINWGIGNLFMFISAANPAIGQATATTLSQLGIVVGTFGGIYILHERKTPDQMVKIVLGSVLVIIGSILITNLKLLSL
ncbi:GRP family sugar transporter [Lentilactobacillus hilgardii]|uniref:Sugar transport protein n=1 Tax=Lentilactobacillus hilgardii (strain ATCC 8290 / DSM 20176 / CCUG 30140 / JCM 1155 / KCTC 3500 / NBRC 15886 / NCIMB 8040 / NRRL B-1843 / 9) TaxID=1423757 RepID=C0XHX8_LENH9|nr:GRP family sugar transporter [Lentilactobacillus hilgardii]EEI21163.1 sugar transport protein [Lentilactobacillus buchneri ATCC 11577]EEI25046.1 sugar transport protein [Lentilactobacillus hilgardii DSM 20176 = ATCC 8290]KRK55300.1 DMT superfamily drug metabolite transporter [Lentilactobacillus hilgardii DSM 20176 = ATCC 8290]MCP9333397.1 glucose transporter [Lentilactobacillus hilgardii]MCP9349327.1 glucose transporter [Lentilactobacillus hilgardii]